MADELVLATTPAEGVRVLAFNRPAKRNALSQELITVFLHHLLEASRDKAVRAIVLTGSGAFFSGKNKNGLPPRSKPWSLADST